MSTNIHHTVEKTKNKIYVLDTNVLLHDPQAIYTFKSVIIGIPFVVLEEIDHFKRETGTIGKNARAIVRILDQLRIKGNLHQGVPLDDASQSSILKIFTLHGTVDLKSDTAASIKDNIILQITQRLAKIHTHVTLVTKDINLRVKADILNISAQDYTKGYFNDESFFKGWQRLAVPAKVLKDATPNKIGSLISTAKKEKLYNNEFIILESENNPENNRLFRYLHSNSFKEVIPICIMNSFQARNIQQLMALDLLMDDNITLISLIGSAGTGKTFLTLVAGLYKVMHQKLFNKLLVTRPVIALGADIGFLPGDMQEKLYFWMQPVHDNLEFIASRMVQQNVELFNKSKKNRHNRNNITKKTYFPSPQIYMVEELQRRGILSLEAITYMRGRSIPQQFMFIDEVQNLTPHEVKTLISRAGQGTKVILAGDPYQIDSPYLDFNSNGLTITTDKMKGQPIFGTTFLTLSERSELSRIAGQYL